MRPCDAVDDDLTIVFVDDDDAMRELMIALVQRDLPNVRISGFSNARGAWERVNAGGVALVITDCAMPGMDGFTLVRAIRARLDAIPILMVSGTRDAEADAMDAGATRYLAKDRVTFDLVNCVRELLRLEPGES